MCGPHKGGVWREGQPAVHTAQEIPGLVTLAGSLPLPPSAASQPRIQIQSQNTTAISMLHYWPSSKRPSRGCTSSAGSES